MIAFLKFENAWDLEPIRKTELAEFYWLTDIKTNEISRAFEGQVTSAGIATAAGPATILNFKCTRCAGPVHVFSRENAKKRFDYLASGRGPHLVPWANPGICAPCSRELEDNSQAYYRAQDEARNRRERELQTMPYREYLQTPEWQETRKQALSRAKYHCQTCSSADRLQVHHRTYVRRGREYSSDLIVLCGSCHTLFHENSKLAEGGRADGFASRERASA